MWSVFPVADHLARLTLGFFIPATTRDDMTIDSETLLAVMQRRQYRVFEGEWNLNLVGVRAAERRADTFNDYICVLFQCQQRWLLLSLPVD